MFAMNQTTGTLLAASTALCVATAASADILPAPSQEFPTIQSAIDAAQPGDEVQVAPGLHEEDLTIFARSGFIALVGSAEGSIIRGNLEITSSEIIVISTLQFEDPGDDPNSFTPLIGIRQSAEVFVLESSFLDSDPNTVATGISIADSLGVEVSSCRFAGLETSLNLVRVQTARVSGNRITAGLRDSTFVSVFQTQDCSMTENAIQRTLIIAAQVERYLLQSNRFKGSEVAIGNSATAVVTQNRFKKAARDQFVVAALLVANCTESEVTGNTFRRTDGASDEDAGIRVQRTAGLLVADNVLTRAGEFGIHLESDANIIRGNKALRSGQFDLFDAEGGNEFEANRFGTSNL